MVPTAGLSDQITPEFMLRVAIAENDWVCEAASETLLGLTAMLTLDGATT
jgi:hypothetical protein